MGGKMRGPLPDPNARRRNAPTIPTTQLPASGRLGRVPTPPKWVELGEAGMAWWKWAWRTPQAAAWSDGHSVMIARRASLEDDNAALSRVESLDAIELLDAEKFQALKALVDGLARLVTNRLAIQREMRELDDRLGLTPKGMAALRWQIVDDTSSEAPARNGNVIPLEDRRRRLVDDAA